LTPVHFLFTLNTNGDITACCGASSYWKSDNPLNFGNIRDHSVAEILKKADANPVLHIVRLWGPAGLLKLAQKQAELENVDYTAPHSIEMCGLCAFMNNDPVSIGLVQKALRNPELIREIAIARLYELGEPSMLLELGKND
jgi:Iron-sulfur cluster-binding domain